MALAPGTRVGPYEIAGLLGEGGMGSVYRARDPRLDRDVALKVLRAEVMADRDRQTRFVQEAKAASALNHPNIVTVYDVGAENGLAYLVMELVEGRSLDQLIPRGGMRLPEVLRIGAQIADAFARAHASQIVHRDLKPANVMLQADGRVKVLDFGLAKVVAAGRDAGARGEVTQTAEGTIMGTAAYMSPEQAEGKPLDGRSDIFSLGALLYELATGVRAFRGDSQASVIADVLREDPPPIAEHRPDLPPELARLITRCLRKDPARRVQSMADLKVAFDELRDDVDSGKLAAPAVVAHRRSSRLLWWLGGAAAIAAATLAGILIGQQRTTVPAAAVTALQPVPLTSYPGTEDYPSLSPDGNQVTFTWDGEQADNADVYIKLIGAGPPLRLTTDPRPDLRPRWSPDGRQIAFIRLFDDQTFAVLLIPALGGQERRVGQFHTRIENGFILASLAWGADPRFLFVSGAPTRGEPNHIQRVSIESGEVATLISAEPGTEGFASLALAPDGRTLATVYQDASGFRGVLLIALSPDGAVQGSRHLTSIAGHVIALTWTADSRDLVFRFSANLPLPLHRVAVAGGEPQPMAWVGPDASMPAISTAGARMVFVRFYRDTNIWRVALNTADGGAPSLDQLAQSSFREVFPQYSPDGTRLVFYSNRGGSIQIWTSDVDGSRAVQLTNMDAFATTGSPRWSPDGTRVVFDSNAGGDYQVYEISAEGGQPRPITQGKSSSFTGAWSPDGRWIYFTSNRSGQLEIWRVLSGGGEPEQVTRAGGQAPTVSADSAWVYYTKRDGADGLWRMAVGGGEESRVVDAVHRYNYALTSGGVYFMQPPRPDGTGTVRYLEFKTSQTRDIIDTVKPPDLGLAVSPDGRYLLFTSLDYSGRDLMLVENFR